MFESIPGLEPFLLTVLIVVGPWVYSEISRIRRAPAGASTPRAFVWWALPLVLVNTLYLLSRIFLHPPQNIFTALRVPLNAPPATLRALLLARTDPPAAALPPALEELLARLSSFDIRLLYVRIGHDAVAGCEHCAAPDEFAFFAMPRTLLEYVRAAALAGALTSRSTHKRRWRPWALGALLVGALTEQYVLASVRVVVPPSGVGVTMWHDRAWFYRQLLTILLPVALYFLPPAAHVPSAAETLDGAAQSLDRALGALRMADLARSAVLRAEPLRARAEAHWADDASAGEWARVDDGVRREAERAGIGYGDGGKLREHARNAVRGMFAAFKLPPPPAET